MRIPKNEQSKKKRPNYLQDLLAYNKYLENSLAPHGYFIAEYTAARHSISLNLFGDVEAKFSDSCAETTCFPNLGIKVASTNFDIVGWATPITALQVLLKVALVTSTFFPVREKINESLSYL